MYEHLYNYGQSQHNDIKDIQPYGDASDAYDYSNSLTDISSTVALPAFAFLSQQTDLAAHLQLQDPPHFNDFHHDITNNSGNNSNNNTHANTEDDHTHTLNQFRSAFESIDQNNITDATFSLQHLYNPVDINSIVHNPILPVPDLPATLPPLNTSTSVTTATATTTAVTAPIAVSLPSSLPTTVPASSSLQPTTSVIQPEELSPASKKQKITRGARERAPWTPAEDTRLRFAVQLFGDKTEKWAKIAEYVPGRTNKNCRKRWFHSLDPSLRKGAWTDEEDRILREGVTKFPNQWSKIADLLEGRTDDQCAKRWRESLDPSIDRSDWTFEEDKRLAEKYEEFGSQWQKIAQFFDGRPGLHCRNRWRKLQRISQIKKEKARAVALGGIVSTTTNIQMNGKKNDHQNNNNNNNNHLQLNNNNNHSNSSNNNLSHRNNSLSSNMNMNMNMNATSFINLGPDDSSTNRYRNNNNNNNNNNSNDNNNINNQSPGKLSISLSSANPSGTTTNTSLSTPSLSTCSGNSITTPLLTPPDAISPSENSALSSLLQQNTSSLPTPQYEMSSTTFKTINTSYQSMNDRHQQDYDFPEPLAHLKPYGCDVNGCYQTFGQSSELFYHMKNSHPSLTGIEKPYRCAIINCSKKYKNINGLQYHLREAKGISSHSIAISTSDNNSNNNNHNNNNNNNGSTKNQHHGELMTPIPMITKFDQNNNNNNKITTTTTTDNNNNNNLPITSSSASSTFVNLSTTEASSHLSNISINNGIKDNNTNNDNNTEHNPFLICPFIDCKKTFSTLNELRMHQNHGHRMTFALTSTPISTSTKKDSSSSSSTSISNTSLVDSLLQSSSNNPSTLIPPSHQQFRFKKEKWELV